MEKMIRVCTAVALAGMFVAPAVCASGVSEAGKKWDPSRALAYPVPTEIGVRANPTARHIQRTMKALAESTAEKPAHVRVLFYGQSIVGQQWHTILMDGLRRKYPTAKFEVENRAIGGFTSPDLIRTAESDLYPYYPDLLFFHVYGPLDKYEAIVRKVRETTTAEIVLWTSHLQVGDDPRKLLENRNERSRGILEIGEKYGCMVVDLNRKWCEMLIRNRMNPADLLTDNIHMKAPATGAPSFAYYAGMIGEELCRMPGLSGEPEFSGMITEVKATDELAFDGNRVVAVSDGSGMGETRIALDGREPSSFAEMHYSTRPSAFVSWMPMIKHVDRAPEAMPVVEDWTLTYIEGTKSLGNPIHYRVKGSVTGDDGEGWNTNDFRSASGRAIIAKSDFHTWQYGYFYKCNEKYLKEHDQTWSKDSKPGQTITWSVRPLYANPLVASAAGTRTTLVQNCSNGRHRLTLKPSDGARSGVSRFLVHCPAKPLVLKIPSGRHFLKEPMRLTVADSDVTIVGEPGAVLDGSVRLGKFVPDAQGVWHAKVPAGVVADQLFVNDRRATPARSPNRFAFHMAEPVGEWMSPLHNRMTDLGAKGFRVGESEANLIEAIPEAEREGMRLFVYTSWDTYTMPFEWYDPKGRVICGRGWGRNALFRFGPHCPRYRLENYRGALDEPGEWFFDRKAGEVLYLPLPDETPETAVACVPVVETLLEIVGATNVTVRNLAFEHAAWRHPGEVKNGQAAMSVNSFAVRVADAGNVVFENCRVRHAGAHGLRFQGGTSRCRVSRCLFEDLGAGGIYIGDPTWKKEAGDAALTRFVTVEDSILRDGGVTLPGAVGIWLGQVHDCAVVHNDVSYFRYTGVSAGWTWSSTRETPVARNRISYNRLHHLCLGELNDMGGIYTLGISTDSEEIGNWIHDIAGYPWSISPAWGIYTDEGSTGFLIASNLVENVRDGAIHQNYGNANRFENNIFANCGKGKSFVWRSTPSKGQATFSLTNNIFYTTDRSAKAFWKYDYFGACPIRGFDAKDVPADGNVWWFGGEPSKDAFNLGDWAAWRAEGHDARGATADPGFVDAANGDWRLKPGSPALKAGFRPFDWRQSGVRGDAAWKREAEGFALPPFEDYPEPPRWSRDADRFGFEGGQPAEIFLAGIRGKGIRATTKTVRSGRMALEIEDTVLSGPQSFLPHFSMSTPGVTGIRFGYSFAADEKARVTMQARQWNVPGKSYATGIHLPFGDGKLSVNGRPLVTLRPLQWCDLVFEADFSADRVPTWKVTATPQGGKPVTLQIPSAEGDCRQMNWIGWMSECAERACWYFDDFWYELRR